MTDLEISVVLPCLNEAAAVGVVIDAARDGLDRAGRSGEILVVDNGSTDGSGEIAAKHGARVITESRKGYGRAYLAGLRAAKGRYIVMADADGTYPLEMLGDFVKELESGSDLVVGSRFKGSIRRKAMPFMHRWIGNPLLTWILKMFFGVRVSDAHCGMRALRAAAVDRLVLRTTGMEFASEMIVKASRCGLVVTEIPIEYRARTGDSKLRRWRDGWRHLRFLLLYSPTYLFLVPGLMLTMVGTALVVPLAAGPIELFDREWGIHTLVGGSAMAIVGVQVLFLGVFARTYATLYLGDHEPRLEAWWGRFRLEHGLAIGGLFFLVGLAIFVGIFVDWAGRGFENLDLGHPAVTGMLLMSVGAQILFGSFFLGVLGLRPD